MKIVSLSDYAKSKSETEGGALAITFFGHRFESSAGERQLSFTVNVEDGDVLGVLQAVKEEGGIGRIVEGQYLYLPYPCAAVVVHQVGDKPFQNLTQSEYSFQC
jgi:hypothetical protein